MSKSKSSSSLQEGPRPASASVVSEITKNCALCTKDMRKRKRRSSSTGNTAMTAQSALYEAPDLLSSSLDQESGLEEPLAEPDSFPRSVINNFFTALDKELSSSLSSDQPASTYQKKKGTKRERSSISTPEFKLKPRPQGKSSAASTRRMDLNNGALRSSFKTPPPRIFIPFLPSLPKHSSSQAQKQPPSQQKPLPPPPLIPQFHGHASSSSSRDLKIHHEQKDSKFLLRPRKSRRTFSKSKPLSSPPQLIPSFDFGISAATRDAVTPPPVQKRPAAPFTSPLSSMATNTALSMNSVETLHKKGDDRVIVVAKPIARRPVITPSNRHNSNSKKTKSSNLSIDDCSPRRLFPSSVRNHERTGVASSLGSSMENSAFSFSPSLLSTTMRRTLSADEDE